MSDTLSPAENPGREWPRIAALVLVLFASSIVQPSLLVAVPFLVLIGGTGVRGAPMLLAALLAMTLSIAGVRDGVWYVERAWALMVGAGFLAMTVGMPKIRLAERALVAVLGSAAVAAVMLWLRPGSWAAVEYVVADRVTTGVSMVLDSFIVLRGGEALSPALVAAVYQMADSQIRHFPALTGIVSMAGACVAWVVYSRLARRPRPALGPLRDFRFNDHLIWLFVGGLLLLVGRSGEAFGRLGSNLVLFMGALYALRGVGVIAFLTGGLSLFGYVMTGIGLLIIPPVVVVGATMIGLGDTWLDVRTRVRDLAA